MEDKYLPIGSVIKLKNAKKRLMITGYCMHEKENRDKLYDYCGCLFPEGIIDTKKIALFNHNQIEKIYYKGLSDDDSKNFIASIVEKIK